MGYVDIFTKIIGENIGFGHSERLKSNYHNFRCNSDLVI